jgi:hypothetical protein
MRRPNVFREVLCAAAIRYGDAKLACERGAETPEERAAKAEKWREAESDLHRASRAYATNERKRKNP